eukprot:gene30531-38173_t
MSDKPTEELRLLTSLLQSLGWSGPSDTTIYNGMPNFDTDKTKQSISAWYKYKKKKMKVADDKSVVWRSSTQILRLNLGVYPYDLTGNRFRNGRRCRGGLKRDPAFEARMARIEKNRELRASTAKIKSVCVACGRRQAKTLQGKCQFCAKGRKYFECDVAGCVKLASRRGSQKTRCRAHGGGHRCATCGLAGVQNLNSNCAMCADHLRTRGAQEATVQGWLDATEDLNNVVLEVDEHHHQSYEVTCEIVRMQKLHDQRPEYPLHLIRFNPHRDDPFKRETLLKTLRDAIAMPNRSRNEPSGILVEYIGYPRSRERLMQTTRQLLLRNVSAANSRGALLADRDGGDRAEAAERMRRCASDLVDAYEAYKNACRECVHA